MDRPIGMFDSGFGGSTVARAVIDPLPAEDLVYIGDAGRYPYPPTPSTEVRGYARESVAGLAEDHNVKAIVVACNAAAAALLEELREQLDIPIIDVIQPGATSPTRLRSRPTACCGRAVCFATPGRESAATASSRAATSTHSASSGPDSSGPSSTPPSRGRPATPSSRQKERPR